jgi:hypothetical protein
VTEIRWRLHLASPPEAVIMALKAAADHDVDLRNHDAERTWWQGSWWQGYCDN